MGNKFMSKTFGNAVDARNQLSEAEQERVHLFDLGYMVGPNAIMAGLAIKAGAAGFEAAEALELIKHVQQNAYYTTFMNTTSVMRLVKHGRVPKEIGDKISN